MKSELVSIIIPTYNRGHFLIDTLNSIRDQTYKNWECIVIDDHSEDATDNLMSNIIAKDIRFKYKRRPSKLPKGANSCRNYGFTLSKGEYINWFDSDDLMSPKHLEMLVKRLEAKDLDFVVGDSSNFVNSKNKISGKPYQFNRSNLEISAIAFAQQRIGWITDDFLGKRSTLLNIKFNTDIRTDGDEYNFFTRYLLKGYKGEFVNEELTYHRVHENTLSNPELYDKIQTFFKVSQIQYLTFLDIRDTPGIELKKWFLKGYMLNSFQLAKDKKIPFRLLGSVFHIFRYYPKQKAIAYFASIFLAVFFKKGYNLLKYARH